MSIPEDVVYIVRPGELNDELRFSLRSLADHVPHKRVWLVGHRPLWVRDVEHVSGNLAGDKWRNVPDNLRIACEVIPADRLLIMNDDFFVTRRVRSIPSLYRGALQDHLNRVKPGPWRQSLRKTLKHLQALGIEEPRSYELHVPVVMDRGLLLETALAALEYPQLPPQWRTLYGNLNRVQACQSGDGKGKDVTDGLFVSTDDSWWVGGAIGSWLRSSFQRPSRYEVPLSYDASRRSGMARFRNTKYPALRFVTEGERTFKFVGGRLQAEGPAADAVRNHALAFPRSGITEVNESDLAIDMAGALMDSARAASGPMEAPEAEAQADQPRVPYKALQAALKAAGLSARGDYDTLAARLEATR